MFYFHKLHKVNTVKKEVGIARSTKASSQELGTAVLIPFPSTVQPMQNFQCPPQFMNPCLTETSLPPPPLTQWLRLIKITSLFLVPHLQHTQCIKAHTPAHIWNPPPSLIQLSSYSSCTPPSWDDRASQNPPKWVQLFLHFWLLSRLFSAGAWRHQDKKV